jgi:predicted TIM-barrel fold metal-dependent hydrolase
MVDGFGPDRLVWGSDVGQSMLWSYSEKVAMAREAAGLLTPEERANFLSGNAARIYRIAGKTSGAGSSGLPSAA